MPFQTKSWLLVILIGLLPTTLASKERDDRATAALTQEHRDWLEETRVLLTRAERKLFLSLGTDYQRETFIRRFWKSRDPYPATQRNEFRDDWYARLDEARHRYGSITVDRALVLLLHGPPAVVDETQCGLILWPFESWYYPTTDGLPDHFYFIFYQPAGGGPFKLWQPADGLLKLVAIRREIGIGDDENYYAIRKSLSKYCPVDWIDVIDALETQRAHGRVNALDLVLAPPRAQDTEWLETFRAFSTDLPPEDGNAASGPRAAELGLDLDLGFPGIKGSRTVVQAVLSVPAEGLESSDLAGPSVFSFLLNGEILRGDELFESFRYQFDVPADQQSGTHVPLVVERHLRPGEYRLIVLLEELTSQRRVRREWPLIVPKVSRPTNAVADAEITATLDAARNDLDVAAARNDTPTVTLVVPDQDIYTGSLRVEAEATGEGIHKVRFSLDGKALLTKNRPPFSVDVRLGDLPRDFVLEAEALDGQGIRIAHDQRVLNGATQSFLVRFLTPEQGAHYNDFVDAEAEVEVPDGQTLDRLELFLDEQRVATLFQPPFRQRIALPPGNTTRYVRAVAHLADGHNTEAIALFNAPDYVDTLDVQLNELYVAVLNQQGQPTQGLTGSDFRVLDGGNPETIMRFEAVNDLPIHATLMIDTSASMVKSLPQAQRAALGFLENILTPKDRAAVITFNEAPSLRQKLTNDLDALRSSLAGLHAERGTRFWDSLVYGLQYMKGLTGQRALLVLTDGSDRSSRFDFEKALATARRSGITIYPVGLDIGKLAVDTRSKLKRLAETTGGQSYFIQSAKELDTVYAQIQGRLRARYLIAYQPSKPLTAGEFRAVEIQVLRPGHTVESVAGYDR